MFNPLISIIIPTYNEEKEIGECLKSLKSQSYKNIEIIIVDDGSTDKTTAIAGDFKGVKLLRQEHKGTGAARNLGANKSKGEILIFVDADMTFHKDYLKNLIRPILKDKKGEVVGTEEALQIAKNLDNIWSRCQGKIMSDPKNKDRRIFRAIRKTKFLEFGGFDSKYGYADDQTFWFKYKLNSTIAENAVCYHKNPGTLKGVYKQSSWIGSSSLSKWLYIPVINLLIVFLLFLLFPIMIVLLSMKKCYKNKDFSIFLFMLIFMTVRYFGALSGYLRKILWNKNFR